MEPLYDHETVSSAPQKEYQGHCAKPTGELDIRAMLKDSRLDIEWTPEKSQEVFQKILARIKEEPRE